MTSSNPREPWTRRVIRKLERQGVPAEAIEAAQRAGFGPPNRFIPSLEAPPYYPNSVRRILERRSDE